ncbi:phage tail protein [Agrobacterium vitis]|uniref:phage tail protein n=1 Tax=Agrobacterium vitis TaxID=373 RepID=UPI0008DBF93F|nr:phage tail protein [Agrobacterium vitis]
MAIFSGIAAIVSGVASAIGAVSTFIGGMGIIGSTLLKAAVGVGLNYLASAVAGKNKASTASFAVNGQLQSGGTVPRSIIFGMTATAGSLVYANTWGNAGKTPNAYVTQVIALADAPIKSLLVPVVNGVACEIDFDHPHAEYGWPVLDYRKGNTDYLWLKFYDGTQTQADSFLVNRVSSTVRPYENTRVGHGVAYVIATSRVNQELFSGFPSFKFVLDGMRLYDPSKDSSVGGNGTQRWSDASTWGGDGDRLPVVQLYALMRGIRWNGQWLYGLQTVTERRLPASHWIAQIGKCRTLIEGADGMEATYRSGAEVQVSAAIQDAAQAMLTACNGRLAEIGGTYKPFIGVSDEPVMTFTDADILSTEEQSFAPFFGLSDAVNGISASYPSQDDAWNMTEAPPLYNGDYEVEDGNRRLLSDVSLDFVPYAAQVQRLMQSALKEARRARRHTISMPPKFGVLEPGDIVATSSNRNGYVEKRFRVDGVLDQPNLDVVLDITEVDPSDYDWNQGSDYQAPVPGSVSSGVPAAQSTTGWSVVAGSVTDSDSQDRRPAIVVSCTADLDDVARVWVRAYIKATGALVYDSDAHPYSGNATWTLSGAWCLALTEYEVEGKLVPISSRETFWSERISVTTLNLSESTDILDNSVTSAKIADAAVTASKIMDQAVTNLKLADAAVSTSKLQVAAVTQEVLASGSVIASKLADAAVTSVKLAAQAVDATKLASSIEAVKVVSALPTSRVSAYVTFNGEAYRWNGSAYVKTVATAELTGQLITSQIADAAILASKLADGIVTGTKMAADTITANNLAAGAVTAKSLVLTDYTNLVANGNFTSSDLVNIWNINKGLSDDNVYFAANIGQAGAQALVMQKPTVASAHDLSISLKPGFYIPVEGGKTYTYDISYYAIPSASSGGFWFKVLYLDAAKAFLSEAFLVSNQPIATTRTRFVSQTVMPANARFISLEIFSNTSNTTTINLILDYIALRRSNAAELIVDGSIVANMLSAGSVTTDKLAANSVIAGKIAAGAISTDQLAANAVTTSKMAAGSVTTDILAVGQGANFIKNSDFSAGLTGWGLEYTNNAAAFAPLIIRTDTYAPTPGSLEIQQINGTQNVEYGVVYKKDGTNIDTVSVEAGKWYELSAYYLGHRCNGLMLFIGFADKNGSVISYAQSSLFSANQNTDPGKQLSNYQRAWFKAQAPAGSVYAYPFFRHKGTVNAQANSYLWIHKPFFGEAVANQTQPTPWSQAGVTLIQSGNIVTGSVTTESLAAGSVVATKLAAGSVTTSALAAGSVVASTIAGGTITGDKVAADTIGANNLAAGSVTAKSLTLTDYTNLVPNGNFSSSDLAAIWTFNKGLSDDTVSFVPGGSSSGGQALLLRKPTVGSAHDLSITLNLSYAIPVEGGKVYAFDVSYYTYANPSAGGFWWRMFYYDGAKNYLGSYADLVSNQPISTARLRYNSRITMPSTARYVTFQVFNSADNASAANLLIDYLALRKANAAELIVDGSITADKLAVNSLSAITANLGTVTAGVIQASNGKMVINLGAGSMEWYE